MSRFEELGVEVSDIHTFADIALGGLLVISVYKIRQLMKRSKVLEARAVAAQTRAHQAEQSGLLEPKTKLLNPEAFREEVVRRTTGSHRARDIGRVHGLAMLDVDDFKMWNDILSHPVVDENILVPVADILRDNLRPDSDLACRFGGEEFVVFFGDTDEEGVVAACNRIQEAINAMRPDIESVTRVGATIAYGQLIPGTDYDKTLELLSVNMLKAKNESGKNQIVGIAVEPILPE